VSKQDSNIAKGPKQDSNKTKGLEEENLIFINNYII
jgi:hypothetical protein